MSESDLAERLAALEARVSALEAAAGSPPEPAGPVADHGEVGYQGSVRLHGEVEWTIRYAAAGVLQLDDQRGAAVLAALGHHTRAAMVRRLLTGPASAAELQRAAGLSSTGQLYHHLRGLTAAGVVEQDARSSYRIPPRAVVPTLVLLLAAADVAGELTARRA